VILSSAKPAFNSRSSWLFLLWLIVDAESTLGSVQVLASEWRTAVNMGLSPTARPSTPRILGLATGSDHKGTTPLPEDITSSTEQPELRTNSYCFCHLPDKSAVQQCCLFCVFDNFRILKKAYHIVFPFDNPISLLPDFCCFESELPPLAPPPP